MHIGDRAQWVVIASAVPAVDSSGDRVGVPPKGGHFLRWTSNEVPHGPAGPPAGRGATSFGVDPCGGET